MVEWKWCAFANTAECVELPVVVKAEDRNRLIGWHAVRKLYLYSILLHLSSTTNMSQLVQFF